MNKPILCILLAGVLQPSFSISQPVDQSIEIVFITTWTFSQKDSIHLSEPSSLSIGPDGSLFIADTGNHRIIKLDNTGRFVRQIGGFGWEKEHFNHPVAVSAENGLDVFIADYYNHRIERYDKDLHYLSSFSSGASWPDNLVFGFPIDVAMSAQGELFCLDGENQRILKLDVLGNPQISFGDYDSGEGRLSQPGHIYISRHERLYVTDEEKGAVLVFDLHGNYLFTFGQGILHKPSGMAENKSDFFIVSDTDLKQILIFFRYYKVLMKLSGSDENHIAFDEPVDVAVWKDRLFVLDRKRSAIDIFRWIFPKPAEVW